MASELPDEARVTLLGSYIVRPENGTGFHPVNRRNARAEEPNWTRAHASRHLQSTACARRGPETLAGCGWLVTGPSPWELGNSVGALWTGNPGEADLPARGEGALFWAGTCELGVRLGGLRAGGLQPTSPFTPSGPHRSLRTSKGIFSHFS